MYNNGPMRTVGRSQTLASRCARCLENQRFWLPCPAGYVQECGVWGGVIAQVMGPERRSVPLNQSWTDVNRRPWVHPIFPFKEVLLGVDTQSKQSVEVLCNHFGQAGMQRLGAFVGELGLVVFSCIGNVLFREKNHSTKRCQRFPFYC